MPSGQHIFCWATFTEKKVKKFLPNLFYMLWSKVAHRRAESLICIQRRQATIFTKLTNHRSLKVIFWLNVYVPLCCFLSVFMREPITDIAKQRLSISINIDNIISASRVWLRGSQMPRVMIKLQHLSTGAGGHRAAVTLHSSLRRKSVWLSPLKRNWKYQGALQCSWHRGTKPHTGVCSDGLEFAQGKSCPT